MVVHLRLCSQSTNRFAASWCAFEADWARGKSAEAYVEKWPDRVDYRATIAGHADCPRGQSDQTGRKKCQQEISSLECHFGSFSRCRAKREA